MLSLGSSKSSPNYPGKRLQTVWGSGRIMYDNVVDGDDDDMMMLMMMMTMMMMMLRMRCRRMRCRRMTLQLFQANHAWALEPWAAMGTCVIHFYERLSFWIRWRTSCLVWRIYIYMCVCVYMCIYILYLNMCVYIYKINIIDINMFRTYNFSLRCVCGN